MSEYLNPSSTPSTRSQATSSDSSFSSPSILDGESQLSSSQSETSLSCSVSEDASLATFESESKKFYICDDVDTTPTLSQARVVEDDGGYQADLESGRHVSKRSRSKLLSKKPRLERCSATLGTTEVPMILIDFDCTPLMYQALDVEPLAADPLDINNYPGSPTSLALGAGDGFGDLVSLAATVSLGPPKAPVGLGMDCVDTVLALPSSSSSFSSLLGRQQSSVFEETPLLEETFPSFPYRKPDTVTQDPDDSLWSELSFGLTSEALQEAFMTDMMSILTSMDSSSDIPSVPAFPQRTVKRPSGLGLGLPSDAGLKINRGRDYEATIGSTVPFDSSNSIASEMSEAMSSSISLSALCTLSPSPSSLASPRPLPPTPTNDSCEIPPCDSPCISPIVSPCGSPGFPTVSPSSSCSGTSPSPSLEIPAQMAMNMLRPQVFPTRELYNIAEESTATLPSAPEEPTREPKQTITKETSKVLKPSKIPVLPYRALPESPVYIPNSAFPSPEMAGYYPLDVVTESRKARAAAKPKSSLPVKIFQKILSATGLSYH